MNFLISTQKEKERMEAERFECFQKPANDDYALTLKTIN